MNKEYRLATAFLAFKQSFKELVEASKALPDEDVSMNYPWYLLDFEEIEPAVEQWCNTQASRLFQNLPDMIDNPACLDCPSFSCGFSADGLCKDAKQRSCKNFPKVPFMRNTVLPALYTNYDKDKIDKLSDSELHATYEHLCSIIQKVVNNGK